MVKKDAAHAQVGYTLLLSLLFLAVITSVEQDWVAAATGRPPPADHLQSDHKNMMAVGGVYVCVISQLVRVLVISIDVVTLNSR